jgi:hypothetical protein
LAVQLWSLAAALLLPGHWLLVALSRCRKLVKEKPYLAVAAWCVVALLEQWHCIVPCALLMVFQLLSLMLFDGIGLLCSICFAPLLLLSNAVMFAHSSGVYFAVWVCFGCDIALVPSIIVILTDRD